jgi:beta-phosphoglucomutase-like phosphatase (HAD superfamily)
MAIDTLIFDMDGTMVDSLPFHAQSWVVFCERHGIQIDVHDLLRRTNGSNGLECMRVLFNRPMADDEARPLVHEKESIYRELFAPVFAEVPGFRRFAYRAMDLGLKIGVGTAGDLQNVNFVFSHIKMDPRPSTIVRGDEGLPGKPEPAIFLEAARRLGAEPSRCVVFEDAPLGIEAARRAGMRAVGICTTHTPDELSGHHVIAHARHFDELLQSDFLGNIHAHA